MKPTHRVTIKHKDRNYSHEVGSAWIDESGRVSFNLNPGVVLSHRDCEDHWLSMYPIGGEGRSRTVDNPHPKSKTDDEPLHDEWYGDHNG